MWGERHKRMMKVSRNGIKTYTQFSYVFQTELSMQAKLKVFVTEEIHGQVLP